MLACCIVLLCIRPTAECPRFSCATLRKVSMSSPCLTGNIKAVDDPSVLRQQLASAFLHSAVPPAQRLDAAAQRAQYLWGLSLHVSDSLSVWVAQAAGARALNKFSCRRFTVFWRFDSLCVQNGLKPSFRMQSTATQCERKHLNWPNCWGTPAGEKWL